MRNKKSIKGKAVKGRVENTKYYCTRRQTPLSGIAENSVSSIAVQCLTPIIGVDAHVFVRQIARPERCCLIAAIQYYAHRDLALLHHALAIRLAILAMTAAV